MIPMTIKEKNKERAIRGNFVKIKILILLYIIYII